MNATRSLFWDFDIGDFLVPKLHLGTHLSRQLHCVGMIIISYAERSKASKTSSVPKCNLGTRRRGAQFGSSVPPRLISVSPPGSRGSRYFQCLAIKALIGA